MKKILFCILLAVANILCVSAQRTTDKLDRGLVAVKTGTSSTFVSWRIQADEYYDATYNLYRNGQKIASNLKVSNYTDNQYSASNKYKVEAVKHTGTEMSGESTPWATTYLEIVPKHDKSIVSTLIPNDACCVDVDGDGVVEILLKYDNKEEAAALYPKAGNNGEYTIMECLKLDGTVLWWVNCGPNMGDFQNNEQNIVGYDWDLDGKGEVVMRLEEGSVVHMADGTTYAIGADGKNGTSWTNYRIPKGEGSTEWFTYYGKEFLYYCEGATGKPYVVMDYPCKRLEAGETDLNKAWGDGYGHRSNKHFFGAPYLDGRKPSIFIGRGIYTRHKFVALDVDPVTHQLTERWRWMNNTAGSWKGQGYHNYAVVDVDWDGRDEIVWGSMVIDDNGKGLSTTGLGHGDAQHHGDLDPYSWGQEGFFCNEDKPGNNFRDLTTSKIYYRNVASNDDGRCIMGNFSNEYPGSIGSSSRDYDNAVSSVIHNRIPGSNTSGMSQNFRCYWDGDLNEETFNYTNGKNTAGGIYKYQKGLIASFAGSMTNNDTKGTPSFMGDILGDWREEFIMRTAADNIRIYTTTIPTEWRNYSLWYDKQYRNGMVWEPCGYNQPPHASYFLGELEGITSAPPAETMMGRTEVANGGTISHNGEDVITCETNDMTVTIADGATPYLYVDNAPSWVQGSAPSEASDPNQPITYKYYTHTLQGGAFGGATRVVKQGEGTLVMPAVDMPYTGNTDVWGGTLNLNGSIANSALWLNRFAKLNTPATPVTIKSLAAEYGSVISAGGTDAVSTINVTGDMKMGFGSRLKVDLYSNDMSADKLNAAKLIIEKKNWQNGPEYLNPVLEFVCHLKSGETRLTEGKYNLGKIGTVEGNISDIKIEGISIVKASLAMENGDLILNVEGVREPTNIEWNGDKSMTWDVATTENFVTHDVARSPESFIEGDNVYLTDNAQRTVVNIPANVEVRPASLVYTANKNITVSGDGKITAGSFTSAGQSAITMSTNNTYTGGNHLLSGVTKVSTLSNSVQAFGNLGGVTNSASLFTIENSAVLNNTAAVTNGSAIKIVTNGVIQADASFTQQGAISGDTLIKRGSGAMTMSGNFSGRRITVEKGSFAYTGAAFSKTVSAKGGSTISGVGLVNSAFNVPEGESATLTLASNAYTHYTGTLTGAGTLTVNPTNTSNRVSIDGNWSAFKGTIKYTNTSIYMPIRNTYGFTNATLDVAANCRVSSTPLNFTIGKLTGSGILTSPISNDFNSQAAVSGSNTWRIGNSFAENGDFTFPGTFSDDNSSNIKCNFQKIGTCTMTVSGKWTNSGSIAVNGGTLICTGTLGKGALTVANGATLIARSATVATTAKNNPVTNSSVTVNGTLQSGNSATSTSNNYLCFGAGALKVNATGTLRMGIRTATSYTRIIGTGATTSAVTVYDGATLQVFFDTASPYNPATTIGTDESKYDTFAFISGFATTNIGALNFDLPTLPENYEWDTSDIQNGNLKVHYVKSTAVHSIAASAPVTVKVTNSQGIIMTQYASVMNTVITDFNTKSLPAGMYILTITDANGNQQTRKISK